MGNDMKKIACQYAIVRFSPFIETGEFANIGIVIISPQNRFFGFNLATKRYGRITQFFDEINAGIYKNTVYNLKKELERVSRNLKDQGFDKRLSYNDIDYSTNLFNELTRTRETIIRFSEIRTVLTNNPNDTLKELFNYYVERNFVTKKYKETLLESGVRQLLFKAHIGDHFLRDTIGDDAYKVSFPFVKQGINELKKIIKPLHLAHDDSTKISNHGAAWIYKIKKLKEKQLLLTENVLFTLSTPPRDRSNRYEAYSDIKSDLIKVGVKVIPYQDENKNKILEFALN